MDGWMDGWMDGCMDGEVLIIGKVVGWSGWVPKGLTCGEGPQGAWSLIFTLFFDGGFFVFFSMLGRFGEVLGGQNGGQNRFLGCFFRCFFRLRFGIDFGWIFGASEPEKSTKTIIFVQWFLLIFTKSTFSKKIRKNLDFGIVFGSQNHEKSRKNGVASHVFS